MTARLPLRLDLRVAAVACALFIAGCSQGTAGLGAGASREPSEQSFGPTYPAQPPAGRAVRIDRAALSDDKRTLTVDFVGGPPYLASDPCSQDYEPWLAAHGEALDATVVEVAREHVATFGPNQGCTLEGHPQTYHLALPSPFAGTTVNDLAGGTLYVARPAGLATAGWVPPNWSLQRSFEQEPGPPPIWVQVYAATDVGDGPVEGPGQVVLYQAFGLIGEWSDVRAEKARERGATPVAVKVNGEPQTLWRDPTSGELDLGWTLGGKSFGVVGNSADLTNDGLVKIAEGVTFTGN